MEDIKELAEGILDQTIDDTLFYSLANMFKDRREEMRAWAMLLKVDSSQTATTSPITLPTDFRLPKRVIVGSGFQPYTQVRFTEQHLYRNSSNRFFLDIANGTYTLLGTIGAPGTVYFYYTKTTPTLTANVTPVWPSRFWPILAFEIAAYIMGGQDADDVFARLSPENKLVAQGLERAMENWDNQLQIAGQGGRIGVADSDPELDLGMM